MNDDLERIVKELEAGPCSGNPVFEEAASTIRALVKENERLRELAASYKGDAIDTLAKLREAVEVIYPFLNGGVPLAGMTREEMDYVRRAHAFLASIDGALATMEKPNGQ